MKELTNEGMKDMKKVMNIKVIGYGLWVVVALLVGAPVTAQNQQEWQTSTMVGSGSAYSPQVTEVGATTVSSNVTTTTESYSPAKGPNRAKKDFLDPANPGNQSNESPVGEPWVLAVFALAFGGIVFLRRRREAKG